MILIGKDGLLNVIKEKNSVTLLATGRGNFTRTLLKDFIYISSNIFNRVVEYSEIQTDKLNRLVNSFFVIFASVSFFSTINICFRSYIYQKDPCSENNQIERGNT